MGSGVKRPLVSGLGWLTPLRSAGSKERVPKLSLGLLAEAQTLVHKVYDTARPVCTTPVLEQYTYITFYMLKIRKERITRQYAHSVFYPQLIHYLYKLHI